MDENLSVASWFHVSDRKNNLTRLNRMPINGHQWPLKGPRPGRPRSPLRESSEASFCTVVKSQNSQLKGKGYECYKATRSLKRSLKPRLSPFRSKSSQVTNFWNSICHWQDSCRHHGHIFMSISFIVFKTS